MKPSSNNIRLPVSKMFRQHWTHRLRASAGGVLLASCLSMSGSMLAAAPEIDSSALLTVELWDVQDKAVKLDKFRGKPLIVNFWARWCGPCRREIPELAKIRARYKARGLEVIGIGLEDKPDAVREFAHAYDMDYPIFLAKDKGIPLMQSLGNPRGGLPYTIAVDAQGKVISSKMGLMKPEELEAAAEALLKSAPGGARH